MEDTADEGGLEAAFLAYRKWTEENDVEPGLGNYSANQLFFISFAQQHCVVHKREYSKECPGHHGLEEFRHIRPLMNSQIFAQEFDCPSDTRMNPKNKCIIW